MTCPSTLRAGDSLSLAVTRLTHPASAGWALFCRIIWRSGVGTAYEFTPAADGDAFLIDLTADKTAAWPAGEAIFVQVYTCGDHRSTYTQPITILPNLAAAADFDQRSRAQKGLDDARAALESYLAAGQGHVAEYEVAGRKMKFRAVAEIQSLIDLFYRQVQGEKAAYALLRGKPYVPGRIMYRG